MVTRIYLPSDVVAPPITPTKASIWTATGSEVVTTCGTAKRSSAMTTVSVNDADDTLLRFMMYQHVLPTALAAQTIAVQTVKWQHRASQTNAANNMFLCHVVRVLSSDGSTDRGTIISTGAGVGSEFATSLTNRTGTGTSTAVVAQPGDYLVIETGCRGNPNAAASHDSSMRYGDTAASDLPENETATDDFNPWIEFANDLTFAGTFTPRLTLLGVG